MIKKLIAAYCVLLVSVPAWAQVSTDPVCFDDETEITVIYDATKGSTGLIGSSEVYMHAGVITEEGGTSWEHVVGNWGQDDGVGEMTKVAGESNKWEITLTPRSYFDVPDGTDIYRLGMVFRNGDGSKEGKNDSNGDIFIDLSSDPINLQITSENPNLVDTNEEVVISAVTCGEANYSLYINDVQEETQTTAAFEYTYVVTQSEGENVSVRLVAESGDNANEKEFSFAVRSNTVEEAMPAGVIKGVNYDSDPTKATLVLLAPNSTSVYVIGDFNDWTLSPSYQMKKDGENFWLEISGLTPGQEYVFQYLVDESVRIADPYTDKVSDPWDDKHISDDVYPGLIDYPEGKTTNRASVLQTNQDPFEWQHLSYEKVDSEDLIIYELLIRDFDDRHTFKAVMERLDYLENLGINAIELMPTNEFEGNSSWGYNPNFYFAPDKYYGTKNDFKALIDECHSRGIAVIIDVVLNHSYDSSPLARMYWNQSSGRPAANNPWYNEEHNFQNPDAHWGRDFNHESDYTKDLVDSVNTYWINEYKVDGFRFDFTKGFSNNIKTSSDPWGSNYDADRIDNLKRMADVIWEEDPSSYVIIEHLSENSEEKELADYGFLLWGNMNHDYNEITMGYANGKSISWGYHESRGWENKNLISYMESHDEERLMFKNQEYGNSFLEYNVKDLNTGLSRCKSAAAFFFTVPGPKMIWQFGEFGYDISIDEGGRVGEKPTKWEYLEDPNRKALHDTYKELIGLREKYDVFTEGDFSWEPSGNLKTIHIQKQDTSITILGNFDVTPAEINPKFQSTGTWYNFFGGGEITVEDENAPLLLQAGEFRIYSNKKLHHPDVVLSVESETDISKAFLFYPNPVNDTLNLRTGVTSGETWRIVDVLGRDMLSGQVGQGDNRINVGGLKTGTYVMIIGNTHQKFIKK